MCVCLCIVRGGSSDWQYQSGSSSWAWLRSAGPSILLQCCTASLPAKARASTGPLVIDTYNRLRKEKEIKLAEQKSKILFSCRFQVLLSCGCFKLFKG